MAKQRDTTEQQAPDTRRKGAQKKWKVGIKEMENYKVQQNHHLKKGGMSLLFSPQPFPTTLLCWSTSKQFRTYNFTSYHCFR
jgi:hypothetical protein